MPMRLAAVEQGTEQGGLGGVKTGAVVAHFAQQLAAGDPQFQVYARAAGAFAGIGGVVQQHHQQVAHAGFQAQPHRRVEVALQLDVRPHQAPLRQHFLHRYRFLGVAAVCRCGQRQHPLMAQHQQFAQGIEVFAQFGLGRLLGDVVHQQGHRRQGC